MLDKLNSKIWEWFGKNDPYYGVITYDHYRKENIGPDGLASFFQSGEDYINDVFDAFGQLTGVSPTPGNALDYGCGVGRLVVPLAKRCERVVGIDISPSMLDQAGIHCRERNIANVEFRSSSELPAESGSFDFIHSFIVFQHIPPPEGERILRKLLDLLKPGGIGMLHLTFRRNGTASLKGRVMFSAYQRVPFAYTLRNLVKKDHIVPMYEYNLNRVFHLFNAANCEVMKIEFTDHNFLGAKIFLKKI